MVSTTSFAFSMLSNVTNSYCPCKFSAPVNRFGVGIPLNVIIQPSVPPLKGWISG